MNKRRVSGSGQGELNVESWVAADITLAGRVPLSLSRHGDDRFILLREVERQGYLEIGLRCCFGKFETSAC